MDKNINLKINPHTDKLILIICLLITLFSWLISVNVNMVNNQSVFDLESQEIKADLESHIGNHLDSLYAVRGLFDSSNSVTRDEFVTFVKNLDLGSKDQEFIRISFVSVIKTTDISDFDESIVEEGFKEYKSNIVEGQEYQYVVNYITGFCGK